LPRKKGEEDITKITRLSLGPLLAETIYRIQSHHSITKLFDPVPEKH